MSGYGNVKVTAISVGVTIVVLALLAGIAAATGPGPANDVTPAAAVMPSDAHMAQVPKGTSGLRLKGLSPELKGDLKQIDVVLARLESDAGIFYYFQHTTSKHFLTGTDANKRYLAISATARNSDEVGGLRPSALVQGDGGLVSGAAALSGGAKSQKLLSTPGIEVDVAVNGDGFPSVTIKNSTGLLISAILDQGGADAGITLQPGSNSLTLTLQSGIDQLHLQTYPTGSFNRVVTLIVSINFNSAQGSSSFAGQLIDGRT